MNNIITLGMFEGESFKWLFFKLFWSNADIHDADKHR